MIVDSHVHLASWPTIKSCKAKITYSMRKYGIDYALISHADASEFNDDDTLRLPEKSTLQCLKEVIEYVKESPKTRGAALWFRPVRENGPSEELKAYVDANIQYIKAFKYHPWESKLPVSSPKLKPWLEWERSLNLPLIVHTAADKYSDVAFLEKAAKKYPDLKFVAAHIQLCSDNEKGVEILMRNPNIYGDTAWVRMEVTDFLLRNCSPDKVMFGTDNPIDGPNTYANPMINDYFINKTKLPKDLYERLMYKNAIQFFKLDL